MARMLGRAHKQIRWCRWGCCPAIGNSPLYRRVNRVKSRRSQRAREKARWSAQTWRDREESP